MRFWKWLTGDEPPDGPEVGPGINGRPEIVYYNKARRHGNREVTRDAAEADSDANLLQIVAEAVRDANGHADAADRLAAIRRIADELVCAGLQLRRHVHAITSEIGGAR